MGESKMAGNKLLSPEEFETAMLDLLQEMRWGRPNYLEEYRKGTITREGALVYAMEHSVFAANFPRWLANIAGNCPHLEVRKYLIENMYVEEVKDPTIPTSHYESLVDFAVAVGGDRDFIHKYKGAPVTIMRVSYCDWVSRTRPWLEAFASIAGNEVARGLQMVKRIGKRVKSSREIWSQLNLPEEAMAHWDAAEVADSGEGGHGDAPLDFLKKYADTREKQDACLYSMKERQLVNNVWLDQVGVWSFEASGQTPPTLDGRHPLPFPIKTAAE